MAWHLQGQRSAGAVTRANDRADLSNLNMADDAAHETHLAASKNDLKLQSVLSLLG